MSFESFKFQPFIYEALADKKFSKPTEVQEKLIPVIKRTQCCRAITDREVVRPTHFYCVDG